MRLLVFGSRTFLDMSFMFKKLDKVLEEFNITFIIEGESKGADKLARAWAEGLGIPVLPFSADWKKYKYAAGPIRNTQMLKEGKPDWAIGFIDKPISKTKGSLDMFNKCEAAGVQVTLYYGEMIL